MAPVATAAGGKNSIEKEKKRENLNRLSDGAVEYEARSMGVKISMIYPFFLPRYRGRKRVLCPRVQKRNRVLWREKGASQQQQQKRENGDRKDPSSFLRLISFFLFVGKRALRAEPRLQKVFSAKKRRFGEPQEKPQVPTLNG